MLGTIHSIESMGLADGPGVRSVVFLSGCPLRCQYCHNPDAWGRDGTQMEAKELVSKLLRFRPYWKQDGGVTISGGEPLCQKDFLLELLRRLKEQGVHTCLDTAGAVAGEFQELLQYTDLVLYDVKQVDEAAYHQLTGGDMAVTEDFLRQVQQAGVPMWIRHVVVPGLTDSEAHLGKLQDYVKGLRHVERVELLPYHKLGAHKYGVLGLPDPLEDTQAMDRQRCERLQRKFFHDEGRECVQHVSNISAVERI